MPSSRKKIAGGMPCREGAAGKGLASLPIAPAIVFPRGFRLDWRRFPILGSEESILSRLFVISWRDNLILWSDDLILWSDDLILRSRSGMPMEDGAILRDDGAILGKGSGTLTSGFAILGSRGLGSRSDGAVFQSVLSISQSGVANLRESHATGFRRRLLHSGIQYDAARVQPPSGFQVPSSQFSRRRRGANLATHRACGG